MENNQGNSPYRAAEPIRYDGVSGPGRILIEEELSHTAREAEEKYQETYPPEEQRRINQAENN